MIIPKSIKFHSNLLSESEIRAYYSLKRQDDYYDKRLSNILNDYINTKEFTSNNAKLCFKKQLKRMIVEDKTNTPKFEAFDMWRVNQINVYISRQKTELLQMDGKQPYRKKRVEKSTDENERLKQEIENLKKQLQDKDNEIDYLIEENAKLKYNNDEGSNIDPPNEYLISDTSDEEEEVVEKPKPKPKQFVVHFDTEEVVKEVVKEVEFKTEEQVQKFYSNLSNDTERVNHYLSKLKNKQNQLITKFEKLECKSKYINDIDNEFYDYVELESHMLETLDDEGDEDQLYENPKKDLTYKLQELAN